MHVLRGFACHPDHLKPANSTTSLRADTTTSPQAGPSRTVDHDHAPAASSTPAPVALDSSPALSPSPADESLEAWLARRDPKLGPVAAQLVAVGLDEPTTLLAMSCAEWDELVAVAGLQITPLQAILLRSRVRSLLS